MRLKLLSLSVVLVIALLSTFTAKAAETKPGVYIVVFRTPAHVRVSKPEVFHGFAQDLWTYLKAKNVPLIVDPERGTIETESQMSVESMLNIAKQLHATSLLFVTVDRPFTKWIKVTVQSYSLDGKLLWSEDASDAGSMTGKGGYKKTLDRIEADLDKRLDTAGLPVVKEEFTAKTPGDEKKAEQKTPGEKEP
jgi:hypothetical protein